jgi:hypothetical protein
MRRSLSFFVAKAKLNSYIIIKRGAIMTDLKTVILSAIDNSKKRSVLSLQNNNEECSGSIRLYNFKESPTRNFNVRIFGRQPGI